MDPVSVTSFHLSTLRLAEDEREPTELTEASRSLSQFERKTFKTLLPQLVATSVVASSCIVVGIALAYSAILIPQLENKNSDISVTKAETSWVASVIVLTAPFGALLGGYIMDAIGRLNTLKASAVPGVLGWTLLALASNLPMLIAGRIITGIACSLSAGPAVVYVTEIARKDMRGSLLSLGPAYISLGMVIVYLKGWLMNWRMVAWLSNIYIVVPFSLIVFLPESPAWLVSKGRYKEAKKALKFFYKFQPNLQNIQSQDNTFADLQLTLLIREDEQKKIEDKMTGGGTLKEFRKPTGYKPLLIIVGVFFCQQFSGIYIFLFYSVTFFKKVGTNIDPYLASIWIGVIRLTMSFANTWMLRYFTRRILIMISAFGMGVFTLISGFFTLWIKNGTTDLKWVPVVCLLLYVVASNIGLLTVPWTMTAELFPLKIRSLGHSMTISMVNIIMFVAVQNYVNMEIWFGGSAGVQWFFSGISFATVVYIFVFLPETHKKKLSEIENYFKNNTIYLGHKKRRRTVTVVTDPI